MKKNLIIFFFILHCSLLIPSARDCFSQWVQQTLPVNKPITGIEFVDTLKGWACTSHGSDSGYILYTTNGGTNWLTQFSVLNQDFIDIDMVNSLTGYVSGGSRLYWTTNAGVNWNYINMVPNMDIFDMQFLNKDSAWECGPAIGVADVRTTTDGGFTWTIRNNGINQTDANRVFFLNYSTGFCGGVGWLFKTTNAGLNWTSNGIFGQSVRGIFFLNINTGWLGLSNGRIASTTNGGINWTIRQPFQLNGNNTTDIYFLNSSTGYAGTGWFQKILKTTNAGINWGYQYVPTGSIRISIVDTSNAWCSDIGISHTTNGGGNIIYEGINPISSEVPRDQNLFQNYPNPFNSQTNIEFDITKNSSVKLIVYNAIGEKITELVNARLKPGKYRADWNAGNFSSGLYFYRLIIADKFIDTKKMILIK